ncbi:MAG: hypothetical protein GXP28_03020 [Planctomycetes bacterium]|nr:hypothetical protein [Planctomycetota bacterium]
MDFFNQAVGQVRDLLLSMTPAARVTALLLTGVIAVSLGYLVQQQSASPDDFLFNGEFLPSRDVDAAEAAIAQARLSGYERVGNRIRVPRGNKAEYLAAVADAGALPPNFHTLLEDALDLSPFTDKETRRQRMKAAREQQFSMMIREMDGIDDAQVIYDVTKPRGISGTSMATATVSVRPTLGETIDPRRAKMIKKAVASGIAHLSPDQVTVTNLADGSFYNANGEISPEAFDDPYFQKRITYERHIQSNIESLLRNIPGLVVQVTAELDTMVDRTTRSIEPNGESVARRESSQDTEQETSEINNNGRVGLTAQGPTRGDDQAPEVTIKNKNVTATLDSDNFIPTREETFRETGLTPKNVRVAISIPSNYLLSVWKERERKKGNDVDQPLPNDIQTQLEPLKGPLSDEITALVVPLLPRELAKNVLNDVAITFLESLTPEAVEPPSTANQFLGWAGQNFSTVTMALLAMFSLVMLRSMVKSIPPSEPATAINAATLALQPGPGEEASPGASEGEAKEEGRTKLRLAKGPNLKDDLTEIVREDPDAAAMILRNWISNAG